MSLDVYLELESQCGEHRSAIFVRENGQTREISRDEWDRIHPGREPVTVEVGGDTTVFDYNITHNLNRMAGEAGIYEHLWRPDEIGITKASQLVEPLTDGLVRLKAEPERFRAFNPSNGWGDYEGLVLFVEKYLEACLKYPDATVRVSR